MQTLIEETDHLEAEPGPAFAATPPGKGTPALDRRLQLSKELPDDVVFVDLLEYAHYSQPHGGKGDPKGNGVCWHSCYGAAGAVGGVAGTMEPIADAVRAVASGSGEAAVAGGPRGDRPRRARRSGDVCG